VVVQWQARLNKDGWKSKVATLGTVAGAVVLDKGDASLTIDYTDTGVTPAEVSVRAHGAELERAKESP
jgi:hypothetical protein